MTLQGRYSCADNGTEGDDFWTYTEKHFDCNEDGTFLFIDKSGWGCTSGANAKMQDLQIPGTYVIEGKTLTMTLNVEGGTAVKTGVFSDSKRSFKIDGVDYM